MGWRSFRPNLDAVVKVERIYGELGRAWSAESPEGRIVCFVGRRKEAGDGWDFLARGTTYTEAFTSAAAMRRLSADEMTVVAAAATPPRHIPDFHSSGSRSGVDMWPEERGIRPLPEKVEEARRRAGNRSAELRRLVEMRKRAGGARR